MCACVLMCRCVYVGGGVGDKELEGGQGLCSLLALPVVLVVGGGGERGGLAVCVCSSSPLCCAVVGKRWRTCFLLQLAHACVLAGSGVAQEAIVLRYNRSLDKVLICSHGGSPQEVAVSTLTAVDIVPPPFSKFRVRTHASHVHLPWMSSQWCRVSRGRGKILVCFGYWLW